MLLNMHIFKLFINIQPPQQFQFKITKLQTGKIALCVVRLIIDSLKAISTVCAGTGTDVCIGPTSFKRKTTIRDLIWCTRRPNLQLKLAMHLLKINWNLTRLLSKETETLHMSLSAPWSDNYLIPKAFFPNKLNARQAVCWES